MTTRYDMTALEAFESLNGFDEIAVKQRFGRPVTSLADEDPGMFARALVFVMKRREGLSDTDAHAAAQNMTVREVQDSFADDPDEVMPEQPVTESGKDSTPPGS